MKWGAILSPQTVSKRDAKRNRVKAAKPRWLPSYMDKSREVVAVVNGATDAECQADAVRVACQDKHISTNEFMPVYRKPKSRPKGDGPTVAPLSDYVKKFYVGRLATASSLGFAGATVSYAFPGDK